MTLASIYCQSFINFTQNMGRNSQNIIRKLLIVIYHWLTPLVLVPSNMENFRSMGILPIWCKQIRQNCLDMVPVLFTLSDRRRQGSVSKVGSGPFEGLRLRNIPNFPPVHDNRKILDTYQSDAGTIRGQVGRKSSVKK